MLSGRCLEWLLVVAKDLMVSWLFVVAMAHGQTTLCAVKLKYSEQLKLASEAVGPLLLLVVKA
jgi:hypothetical protein